MKILITNTFVLNGGDAAILRAVMDLLRAAFGRDINFVIYDSNPEIAKHYYADLTFRKLIYLDMGSDIVQRIGSILGVNRKAQMKLEMARFYVGLWCIRHGLLCIARKFLTKIELRTLTDYMSVDLIVSTGGTYLVENYNLVPRIFDYKVTLFLNKPLIFFPQSLGPFTKPAYCRAFKRIFENALLVLLRDEKSLHHLRSVGIERANVHVVADAVFALANPQDLEIAKSIDLYRHTSLKIAISVRDWPYFKNVSREYGKKRYLEALRNVTIHLVEKYGAEITYISTCQGIPENRFDDSNVASKIFEMLPGDVQESIKVDRNFHHIGELQQIIRTHDVVIATRMHMAILSLCLGVPVLPIAYEFKTQELFARMGQGHWVLDIENIDSQLCIDKVDAFLCSLPELRSPMFNAVEWERKQAIKSVPLVRAAFQELVRSSSNSQSESDRKVLADIE